MAIVKITPKFTKAQIQKLVGGKLQKVYEAYFQLLLFVGETFVKNSREKGTYTDRTGNLRNSTGYVILRDGKQIAANFRKVSEGNGKDKTEVDAPSLALEKALEIGKKFPKGF